MAVVWVVAAGGAIDAPGWMACNKKPQAVAQGLAGQTTLMLVALAGFEVLGCWMLASTTG